MIITTFDNLVEEGLFPGCAQSAEQHAKLAELVLINVFSRWVPRRRPLQRCGARGWCGGRGGRRGKQGVRNVLRYRRRHSCIGCRRGSWMRVPHIAFYVHAHSRADCPREGFRACQSGTGWCREVAFKMSQKALEAHATCSRMARGVGTSRSKRVCVAERPMTGLESTNRSESGQFKTGRHELESDSPKKGRVVQGEALLKVIDGSKSAGAE